MPEKYRKRIKQMPKILQIWSILVNFGAIFRLHFCGLLWGYHRTVSFYSNFCNFSEGSWPPSPLLKARFWPSEARSVGLASLGRWPSEARPVKPKRSEACQMREAHLECAKRIQNARSASRMREAHPKCAKRIPTFAKIIPTSYKI